MIIRSDCRGEPRNTSAPNRAISNRDALIDIISMAQQASPKVIRWFVHFDSVEGDKLRGVHQLELVAREGHYLKPLAKVFLGIIDLREKKPREAQRLLGELAHDYPENRLYRK